MIDPQIRLTTWPSGPAVTAPAIAVRDALGVDGPPRLVLHGPVLETKEVADELVFGDFMDFNCDDVHAIAAFEREHGPLGIRIKSSLDHDGEHFPRFVAKQPDTWRDAEPSDFDRHSLAIAELHRQYPERVSGHAVSASLEGWGDDILVSDLSITTRALRACASHLEAMTMWNAERAIPKAWGQQGFGVQDADDAARWFGIIVNDRLRPYHLCVLVPKYDDEHVWWDGVHLENALALQLRNYCNASFHRCENELCDRVFPIGAGRKRRKYHSPKCAKRQSVRNARRKAKEQNR